MRVSLVANVPDEPVGRCIEYIMERDRQLDDAKPGAEVTARDRNRVDRFLPQFVGKLAQLALFELPEITGSFDKIKQRSLGRNGHANAPSYSLIGLGQA